MPNANATVPLMTLLVCWVTCATSASEETLRIDFEQGAELARYQQLDCGRIEAGVVPREPGKPEHCLRIHNPTPATQCGVRLKGPVKLVKNLTLSFDYRTEIEPGFEGAYLGMIFYVEGQQWFWHSDAFSAEWRRAEVPLGSLRPWQGHTVRPGLVFSEIQLYGRVKERTPVKGETKARMTVDLDNIRIGVSERQTSLTDRIRQSTANPPLFHWPPPEAVGPQRLQYSTDPGFANATKVTVDARWNFFTPAEPLEPGCWYWRVWTGSELFEGWSDIERVEVLSDAHRFTTPAMPLDSLVGRPRPRLLPVARLAEADLNSFVIHAYGEKLAIDGGYYDWYGSPHFKAYSMTTLAHNTLLVDGAGQAVCQPGADGRIAHYFDSSGYGYTVGDASDPDVYEGRLSRFDRRVLFIKPGLVVIHDLVAAAEKAARYDWMLHAVTPIETEDANRVFQMACPRAALRGRFLAPADVKLNVTTGFPVEPVDGYSTRPVPADQYDPEWHLYATARTWFWCARRPPADFSKATVWKLTGKSPPWNWAPKAASCEPWRSARGICPTTARRCSTWTNRKTGRAIALSDGRQPSLGCKRQRRLQGTVSDARYTQENGIRQKYSTDGQI